MKISGRIKALIVMAVVLYVVAHVVRAMVMMLLRSSTLWSPLPETSRRATSLTRDSEDSLKHCTRC